MLIAFAFFLSGCSIEKHVEKKTNELVRQLEAVPQWENLEEEVIPWDTAMAMAMKQNLDLKRGQLAIDDAERAVNRIFLDMIPGINLDAMITEDVKNFQGLSADSLTYHTNILFNFPSFTKVPIQYYTAKASVYRARKSMDLKKREIVSKIYKSSQDYIAAQQLYQLQINNIAYDDDGREKMRIEEEWQQQKKRISSELSIAIGNVEKRWTVNPVTLPSVNWSRYKAASRQLDLLVLTMMAMEIEASRLNLLGIKMQYFPELDVNFYSPSLFSSTAGTYGGVYADSSDMKVNLSLSWRLDTQLRVWYQLKSAKASHAFLVEEIKMRMIDRREKIKALLKSRQEFEEWESYKEKRTTFLESRVPMSVEDYKKNRAELVEITKELYNQRIKNTDVEASLIIEYGLL